MERLSPPVSAPQLLQGVDSSFPLAAKQANDQ